MNQEPWGSTRPQGQKQAGSVRAARQRVEAGIPFQPPPVSRPGLRPQWPLNADDDDDLTREHVHELQEDYRNHRGSPPQRPPRPSHDPSNLDGSKVQDQFPVLYKQVHEKETPQNQSNQHRYWEADYATSPHDPSTPGTGISSNSSRLSSGSSVGSIPDFPVPSVPLNMMVPVQPRRSTNIGPPPSARRGASSYYSQSSYVAPIPEETIETPKRSKRDSFASSNAIPQSWADGPPGYYIDGTALEDDNEDSDGRYQRSAENDESSGLVRKASLGKQYRPSLTTVKSNSFSNEGLYQNYKRAQRLEGPMTTIGLTRATRAGTSNVKTNELVKDDGPEPTAFLDPPSEESTEDLVIVSTQDVSGSEDISPMSGSPRGSLEPTNNSRKGRVLGEVESMRTARGDTPELSETPFTEKLAIGGALRPAVGNGRRAESRASLTSLPDLIRRATKVAANLDKGRTASRLGMLDMFNSSNPNLLDKAASNQPRHSIPDMLASFPLPASNTPTGSNYRPLSRWPSPFVNSNSNLQLAQSLATDSRKGAVRRERNRRCCGLPIWGFILVLILLILLVAAAVVIPVVLIVLPRQNQATTPAAADLSDCASSHPCENGGTSLVSSNSCRCVCINGFTGLSCSNPDNSVSGCASSDIDSFKKATVGTSIPRLLTASSSNFSIPLNSSSVLSTFSAENLSCSDENNLVTFSGKAERRSAPEPIISRHALGYSVSFAPRAPVAQDSGAVTSNGIIVAAPTTTTNTQPTLSRPLASATPSSSPNNPSQRDIDFARVAVLYILQQTELSAAVDAQQKMQVALTPGGFVAEEISISPNISVNFLEHQVNVGGMIVGGQH